MNPCPVCGTGNPETTSRCLGCGEPLDARPEIGAASEATPLPPLPDGGLASAMPDWLRPATTSAGAPGATEAAPTVGIRGMPDTDTSTESPSTARPDRFDPATLLTADDLPAWLRALAADTGPIGGAPAAAGDVSQPEAPGSAGVAAAARERTAPPPSPGVPIPGTIARPGGLASLPSQRLAGPPPRLDPGARSRRDDPAWLPPLLLVLLLVAVVALLVVRAMPGG